MIEKPLRVCVISLPSPSTQFILQGLLNLVEILVPICAPLYVVSAKISDAGMPPKVRVRDIRTSMHPIGSMHPLWFSYLVQALKVMLIQVKISLVLLRIFPKFDTLVVFLAAPYLLLPMLLSRLLGKKVMIKTGGFYSEIAPTHHSRFTSGTIVALERLGFALATRIVVESPNEQPKLGKHQNKTRDGGMHFFDMELFVSKVSFAERKTVVGYIGRLTHQKGIPNFIAAMPLILEQRNEIEFLVGGDGPLFDQVEVQLKDDGLQERVRLTGLIPHGEVADYWNKLKLFVLPSKAEGLPRAMLEAMACGTPVLATPVGGIPDIIKDAETGFIMPANSPECIAENVVRALEHPKLDEIVSNARKLVEEGYSYEVVVEKYRQMLSEIVAK